MDTDIEVLVKKAQAGDRAARDAIVEQSKGLVSYLARNLYLSGGDTDDLVQEGMIGLLDAIDDYEESSGVAFNTFAHLCVQRRMTNAITMANRLKNEPLNHFLSMSAGSGDDGERAQIEPEDPVNLDPEKMVLGSVSAERELEELMADLSGREAEVLRLKLTGYDYHQIAEALQISEKSADNTIQRIRKKAQKRFRE